MSKITTTTEKAQPRKISFAWIAFFGLVLFFYFFGLTIPLLGPDEPRYAQVAREMMERGDWITPTLGGSVWFEKPVLLYWLEIVSYKVFGINEFAARFGPALFGLGTIASLWLLGKTAERVSAGENAQSNGRFANWLALIAASTLGIVGFSRGASFDIIITFPITAALVSFYTWHSTDSTRREGAAPSYFSLPLFLFYFFIGVALIAKGLIGLVFPIGIVALFFVLSRRLPDRVFVISLVWGLLLSTVVAATWYLPVYMKHGYGFIDEFFVQQHFQRFLSNKYQHPQPIYFFLWVLPLLTLPWAPFFLAATWKFASNLISSKSKTEEAMDSDPQLRLLALSWLLVPLIFFSFSGSKLPGYILPAVPAAIVLAWLFVHRHLGRSRNWRLTVGAIGSSTLVISLLLLIFVVPRFAASDSVKGLVASASALGHSTEKVLCLNTLSHNAEFYAAGRLVRDDAGHQRRFYAPAEIRSEIEILNSAPVLVLVPLENVSLLTRNDTLDAQLLSENSELAIVEVAIK